MTIEERLKLMLGEKDFVIASLQTQLEELKAKLDNLNKEEIPPRRP